MRAGILTATLATVLLACDQNDPEWTQWERDGEPADRSVIESYSGEEHCDLEGVRFLVMGWPPGESSDQEKRMYVRDPESALADQTLAKFRARAELPEQAKGTGFSSEDGVLWLSPRDQDVVAYLVTGDGTVESWPRTERLVGCD